MVISWVIVFSLAKLYKCPSLTAALSAVGEKIPRVTYIACPAIEGYTEITENPWVLIQIDAEQDSVVVTGR
jgi:hypothetical protein